MYSQEPLFIWLSQYAYQPYMIYCLIVAMMAASAFGLPIPEELTIISVAILAHIGAHPELFPPPYDGAPVVNKWTAAVICVLAVLISDVVVYKIGKSFGGFLTSKPRYKAIFENGNMQKIQGWTQNYGIWAVFFFRFMPGIRFPGHLFCGMMKLNLWKFLFMDSFAAVISIPTQLVLIATYGEEILSSLFKVKTYLLAFIGCLIIYWLIKKIWTFYVSRPIKGNNSY